MANSKTGRHNEQHKVAIPKRPPSSHLSRNGKVARRRLKYLRKRHIRKALLKVEHQQVTQSSLEFANPVTVYGTWVELHGRWRSKAPFAKTKIAQLKSVPLSELKMTALVLGFEVAPMLKENCSTIELSLAYWTDPTVVLHYRKQKKRRASSKHQS